MIRKYPLATVSFILGILSFVHFFGLEKAVLAVIIGNIALKELAPEDKKIRRFAYIGIVLGTLYIAVLLAIAIIKGPEIISTLLNK